uniref:RNA helicase n=1 Tax=Setaria digitata TaxID=48799 RepID=A0A915PKQ7_9BILA
MCTVRASSCDLRKFEMQALHCINEKQPLGYVYLHINNFNSYNGIQRLRSIISSKIGSELRITSFEYSGRIAWAKVALFGEIDEKELMKIFDSLRAEFQLENIEFVPDRHNLALGKSFIFRERNGNGKALHSMVISFNIRKIVLTSKVRIASYLNLKQQNDKSLNRTDIEGTSYDLSCQLMFHSELQTEIMEKQLRKCSSNATPASTYAVSKVQSMSSYIATVCSIPPMRIEDINDKQKEYGEPPTFWLDSMFPKCLDLIFNSEELFPPWIQSVHYIRGGFIRETGKLSKAANCLQYNINDCEQNFLKREISERERRIKIFDEIQAEHVRMLKKSPAAEAIVTERMKKEIERFACGLPVYNIRNDIKDILCNQGRVLLIVSDTGSGKSTQIPQFLVFDGTIAAAQKILCSQPRKGAVCELAGRVAKETSLSSYCFVNIPVYKKGLEPNLSAKINFVTEKHLLDCIQRDHSLSSYGCVMIDEVHERTINTDMCLGMMKKVLRMRPDMKLVISSATMDPEPLLNYFAEFQPKKLEIPGRQYSIKICYEPPFSGSRGIKSLMRDYVDRTVEKVISICASEAEKLPFEDIFWEDSLKTHAAHVMAFLSNPHETLIAEERLSKRLAERKHSVHVKILTLYGNMSVEDRAEVFAPLKPGYHHKVIFATNVGETSITIPGVRHVVDCGLAKNVLELGLITKSAAKQRAGRAGRTGPGVCYRLYSEEQYEEMDSTNVPVILFANLTEIVLYMVAAGIMNPLEFDFIEKPDKRILVQSQALLRSLKAIECREAVLVLTKLGAEMKELPVEPRLAKMILDSVQYGLVAEAAVVCACIHVGSLFHRGNKRNKCILADQRKLSFCEESGDPMTSLAVFRQHIKIPYAQLKYWCFENYVNLKRMKSVFDIAHKICEIISRLRGVNADITKIDLSKARAFIPSLFCRSFGNNLAIYSGLPERGYYDFSEEKYVFIHPSSALKYSDITPEFIVYECSVHTSNDFVMNVCAADPSWLEEIDQTVLEEKRKAKLVPYDITCGNAVKRWIMTHRDNLLHEVGMECIRKRRFDDPYRRLQIYVSVKNLAKLEAFVKRINDETVDELCRRTREVPIIHADYVLHMSGGGTPLEILMPGEFCSMFVGREYINWAKDTAYRKKLDEYFGKFGKVTEFLTFDEEYQRKTGHSCLIRMESKEVAKRAFTYNNENTCGFSIEPRLGRKYSNKLNSYRPSAYRLLIKWWRRPSCGYGHVKLKSRDSDQRIFAFNVISKHLGNFQPSLLSEDLVERDPTVNIDDLYKIKLQSLPLNIDNKELFYTLRSVLDSYGIEFDEAYVVRKKTYPVEDAKALEQHSRRITEHIVRVSKKANITLMPFLNNVELKELDSNGYPFEIKIRAPKHSGEIEFVAFVLFSDMNLGLSVGNALKEAALNGMPLEMGPLNQMHEADVQQMFHYQMKVPIFLFNAIFNDLKDIYDSIDHDRIDFNHYSNVSEKMCYLFVSGENFNFVNEVKAAVDKVINGYTIKCRNNEKVDDVKLPCHRLLTKVGEDFLHELPKRYAVFLNTLPYKMEVKIQGSLSNVEKAKMEIKRFLREWSDADVSQVLILQPPDYQPGTLKVLLAQNNYDLYSLEKKIGCGLHLDANIVRRELLFVGKEAQYQELLEMLRSISNNIQSINSTACEEIGTPVCVVCLCCADLENYCLEACGHYACRSCLNIQLKTAIEMRDFPIVCVACGKPFTWLDLEVLVLGDLNRNKNDDPQKLQPLSDASLAYFVESHGDLYKHCLTPDCRGLHHVTTDAGVVRCRLCGRLQCSKCGKEVHESITCEELAVLRVNADESLRKWIRVILYGDFLSLILGVVSAFWIVFIISRKNFACITFFVMIINLERIKKDGDYVQTKTVVPSLKKLEVVTTCSAHGVSSTSAGSASESNEVYAHMDTEHGGSGADAQELMAEMENDPFIREFIARQHPELFLNPRFNGEDAGFWLIPDENADEELQMLLEDDGAQDFFETQQEFNGLFNEEEPDIVFETYNNFEDDANIV